MFNQIGKQTVSLGTFGGLITLAAPDSLSEGSSPLCYDVDFLVGSVFTRAGLHTRLNASESQNFVWVKTFVQDDGQVWTLALDALGQLWREDVTNSPGTITHIETVLPGDFAYGTTASNREFIAFTNNDIPRQYTVLNGEAIFDRYTQEGPGVAPSPVSSSTANPGLANLTSYSITSNVITFQAVNGFTTGEIVQIAGTGVSYLDGVVLTVLASGLSSSQFEANFTHANVTSTPIAGTATPQTNFAITSITQPGSNALSSSQLLWSSAPDVPNAGQVLTVYYSLTQDTTLVNAFTSGIPVYVYLSGLPSPFPSGTYLVTGIGKSHFSSNNRYYFTVSMASSQYAKTPGNPGNISGAAYQMTLATVVTTTPVPGAVVGNSVSIQGATPTAWNGTWTIVEAPSSGVFAITQTQVASDGTVTYSYTLQSGSTPSTGDLVTVTNTTGDNGQLNVTNAVITATGVGTFNIVLPGGGSAAGPFSETGQAEVSGNTFMIDDGLSFVGGPGSNSPIFGNDSGSGDVVVTGNSLQIAAGTRQVVVLFVTQNGLVTKASPAAVFTVPANTAAIQIQNIPIGPPNVVARWIAFTEAGANGVPGAYFYVIPQPVSTIVNGQAYTYQPTVINDNSTTQGTFSFTDAVLLSSLEIDITGGNNFQQIELGSAQWNVKYKNRMFWGLVQNKIYNFENMSFNGGFLSAAAPFPAGWTADSTNGAGGTLVVSPRFGNSYEITNATGSTQSVYGMITQNAALDSNQVPILSPNTTYSARITASIPAGVTTGSLVLDLVTFDNQIGYGPVLGSMTIPFASLTTSLSITIGTLLTTVMKTVPKNLVIRLYATGIANTANVLVDNIEVFPTDEPLNSTSLFGSYVNNYEAIDGVTGILPVNQTNSQKLYGGFEMYDQLYLLKKASMFSTQDSPGAEPSGWQVQEVSNLVGTCGVNAYDVGEEWAVTICRSGVYVFYGKQPIKISQEIYQVLDAINWNAAESIWLRNDIQNRRIMIGVPMSTPNAYLPNAPTVNNPTSPNVVLVCDYKGLGDVTALGEGEQMHTTMFGTLMSVDMRRKWTLWQIKSPYADFIQQQNGFDETLYICNGIASGKIYDLESTQLSDDGSAIDSLYTTYGWIDEGKAQQLPMLGSHRKIWNYMQFRASGSGSLTIKMLPNQLNPAVPFYAQTLPTVTLATTPPDDYERPLNVAGNLVFVQFRTNAVGAAFSLRRVKLVGGPAPLTLRGNAAQ